MADEIKVDTDIQNELEKVFSASSQNSELFKFAKELYDDIRTKTDIPYRNDMLLKIIKLIYYAKECERFEVTENIPKLSDIINNIILENYYKLSISVGRKGRIEAFTFLNGTRTTEDKQDGFLKRLLGR